MTQPDAASGADGPRPPGAARREAAAEGRPDAGDADDGAPDLGDVLARLRGSHREAAQMLGLLSFLAPRPVPAWLLAEQASGLPDPLEGACRRGAEGVLLAAGPLEEQGLARREDDAVELTDGVGASVRGRMSVRERGEFAAMAVGLLYRAFPHRVGRARHRDRCRTLAPHVRAAARHPAGGGRATAEAVHVLARLGAFHRSEGEPEAAEAAFRQAQELSERGAPVEGPLRAVLADELASVLVGSGSHAEAREMAERAVELAEASLEGDAPQLPLLLSNAATTFREAGALPRAAECYRRAAGAVERAGSGAGRPLLVEILAGLADVEMARERWGAAAEAARRALEGAREEWGDRHPQTARALWILGDAHRARGRHGEAGDLFRRALSVEEALHGDGHPAVGQKALALGRHLQDRGRPGEARSAYRKALRAFEASLGPDSDPAGAARAHLEELDAGG